MVPAAVAAVVPVLANAIPVTTPNTVAAQTICGQPKDPMAKAVKLSKVITSTQLIHSKGRQN